MSFYKDFRLKLLRDVKRIENDYDASLKNNSGSEEDMELFFELAFKRRMSEYTFSEHNRAKHMMFKSALDSIQ
ncbi:hypothetical protein C9382_09655 [Pseudomonas aylmerensis]|uniref:HrpF protein n=1 Tax=Pseudomonas aylmerensis TaxID=1869229 RepID=A0A2T4G336_9PSED|nr:hypothetical protein [Pseudomonas aylmerensis]OCW29579.1 hypothetical protein BBG20_04065 [Pseudomonas aylmerensis]PTC30090.1 hypothetical protein C9382_09655 [Pseudomonas aylmerensis]